VTLNPELLWRVEAMRRQVPPRPQRVPFLVARPDVRPAPSVCLSCGEQFTVEEWVQSSPSVRCGLCVEASRVVVEERDE
jgi:hypothetical protein